MALPGWLADTMAWMPFVGGALIVLVGILVTAFGRRERVTWTLAAFLLLSGALQITFGAWAFATDLRTSYNLRVFGSAAQASTACIYLVFLGLALDSPITRPLRIPAVRILLYAFALAMPIWAASAPLMFWGGPAAPGEGGAWTFPQGPGDVFANWASAAVALVSIVAAFTAWRRSPSGSRMRDRYRAYLIAFAVYDVGFLLSAGGENLLLILAGEPTEAQLLYTGLAWRVALPLLSVAFALLLARALLRHQLFDFELRVKWTLEKSTLAAVFVAVFFVVSEGAQAIFAGWSGSTALGILAAGALVFAIAPLQKLAERVADRAMPEVQATPSYLQFKKLEIYRAAVEGAYEGGHGVDARERATLDRLRGKLGIAAEDAHALEADVAQSFAAPA